MTQSKKLTRKEKEAVYRAAEKIVRGMVPFPCWALEDESPSLAKRYARFYEKNPGDWWMGLEFTNFDTRKNWRAMLLAFFAHCEGDL